MIGIKNPVYSPLDWLKTGCSLHRFHGLAGVAKVRDVVAFECDHQLVSDHTVGTEKRGAGEAVCHSRRGRLAASAMRDTEILSLISRWRHQHRPCLVVVVVIQSQSGGYRCSVDEVQRPGRRLSNGGWHHGLLQVGVIGRLPRSGGVGHGQSGVGVRLIAPNAGLAAITGSVVDVGPVRSRLHFCHHECSCEGSGI